MCGPFVKWIKTQQPWLGNTKILWKFEAPNSKTQQTQGDFRAHFCQGKNPFLFVHFLLWRRRTKNTAEMRQIYNLLKGKWIHVAKIIALLPVLFDYFDLQQYQIYFTISVSGRCSSGTRIVCFNCAMRLSQVYFMGKWCQEKREAFYDWLRNQFRTMRFQTKFLTQAGDVEFILLVPLTVHCISFFHRKMRI